MKTRSIEHFHEVESIPTNLDTLNSNEVKKLKISKSVGVNSKKIQLKFSAN